MYFLIIIILVILITYAYGGLRGAPWVPTITQDIARILQLADIKKDDVFYDLGFGNGKVLFEAHKKGATIKGYEISLLPYILAKIKLFFISDHEKISLKYGDFWLHPLNDADIVFFFLTLKYMNKMEKKLKKELKPGTKVISYVFPFKDWAPKFIDEKPGKPTIYLYII